MKEFIFKDVNVLSKVPIYLLDTLRDIFENLNNIFLCCSKEKKKDYYFAIKKKNIYVWIIRLIPDMNLRRFFFLAIFGKVNTKSYTVLCPFTSSHFMFPFYLIPFPFTWLWGPCEMCHIYRGNLEIFPILWKPAWKKSIISMSLDAPFSSTKWIKITLKAM